MDEVHVDTWAECERTLLDLAARLSRRDESRPGWYSSVLFRGQANADWRLETTFDRYPSTSARLADYFRSVAIAQTQIETFTNHRWDQIDVFNLQFAMRKFDYLRAKLIPHAEVLVYMRHHGFPSPLLDWSRSPYIAGYFACRNAACDRVAVYVYQEHQGQGKLGSSGSAQILSIGPNVRSHPRHFVQQAEYTVCTEFIEGEWRIADHELVFQHGEPHQDALWKVTFPRSQAEVALRAFDQMNISAHSLFGSEEALLETLAFRVLHRGAVT